jgi:magnesium chelatase family protein
VRRYSARLSGALADRLDISLAITQPSAEALAGDEPESSAAALERVLGARERQAARLGEGATNAGCEDRELRRVAALSEAGRASLGRAQSRYALSGRGWTRALRVARTAADLEQSQSIEERHVLAALSLRRRPALS